MKPVRTHSGGLDVVVVEPSGGETAEVNVVLCHGYGAPQTDLVPLAGELSHAIPELGHKVRWIFPGAPLSLAEFGMPGGAAWWPIDMEQLVGQRNWDRYTEEVPDGLPKARRMLLSMLEDLHARTKVPISRTLLGGFSQGAMLATDLALRLEEAPLGLCVLSGTLLSRAAWTERAHRRAGLHVFQSHGRRDPLLPFEIAERLQHLFEEGGMKVSFHPFNGEHTIPLPVLEALAGWLNERLPVRSAK